jgi:hypothetical protein
MNHKQSSFLNSKVQSLSSLALPFLLLVAIITLILNLHWAKQAGMAYLKSRLETPEEQLARAAGLLKYQTHNGGRTWVASQG